MTRLLTFIFFCFLCLQTRAASAALDIDISETNLEITTGFTGATLTLFGTADPVGDIIIVVRGPKNKFTILKKMDVGGLWVHGESVTFKDVPGYYNVASTKPVFQIATETTRKDNRIGVNALTFDPDDHITAEKKSRFQEALIQNMQLNGLYSLTPNSIEFINDHLFKTRIYMPANVPTGTYSIEAFLFRNGQLIDRQKHPFRIEQGGWAGAIHDFAFNEPLLYGLSVIMFALLSSFLAIILLRRE